MQPSDRLDIMTFFVRLSETGTLTEAGRSIGLSQPSSSRLLKRLEAMLDCRLVQRSTREMSLTDAGRRFLSASRIMLDHWQAAVDDLHVERREISGHLRIAVPIGLGQELLASVASRFLLDHPKVTIGWDLRDGRVDLDEGYDLWIHAGVIDCDRLVIRKVGQSRYGLVAAASAHPVEHPGGLVGANAVRLSTVCSPRVVLSCDAGQTYELVQKCVFTTDNLYAALTAVRAGVGFAVLPHWAIREEIGRGGLVLQCPGWQPPDIVLSVAYVSDRYRSRRLDVFLGCLRKELGDNGGLVATLEQEGDQDAAAT